MKTPLITLAWMTGWVALCLSLGGCAVEESETTVTDAKSGLVTVTRKKSKKADDAVWSFANAAVTAYAPPRANVIREK